MENRDLVILAVDRQIVSGLLQKRPSPWAGSSDDNRRRDGSLVGRYAANSITIDMQGRCPRARRIDRTQVARRSEKVSRNARAVAVSGVRFVGGKFDVVHVPVRLEFAQLMFVDEFDSGTDPSLHL